MDKYNKYLKEFQFTENYIDQNYEQVVLKKIERTSIYDANQYDRDSLKLYKKRVEIERKLKEFKEKMFKIMETKPNINKFDYNSFKMPTGLNVSLMDHQCKCMAWLEWRENNFPHGAILGNYLSFIFIFIS